MGNFVPRCSQNTEKDRKLLLRISTFQRFVKKANHLVHFVDLSHQNQNFMVSSMVVSIMLYPAFNSINLQAHA